MKPRDQPATCIEQEEAEEAEEAVRPNQNISAISVQTFEQEAKQIPKVHSTSGIREGICYLLFKILFIPD